MFGCSHVLGRDKIWILFGFYCVVECEFSLTNRKKTVVKLYGEISLVAMEWTKLYSEMTIQNGVLSFLGRESVSNGSVFIPSNGSVFMPKITQAELGDYI